MFTCYQFPIYFFNTIYFILLQVTLFNSHDIKLNDNVTRVEAGVSLDKIMPNTFESRNGQTTLTLLHEMPVLCAESLVEFHKQKLDVKNFDLVMIEMFANECFYSIMREVG